MGHDLSRLGNVPLIFAEATGEVVPGVGVRDCANNHGGFCVEPDLTAGRRDAPSCFIGPDLDATQETLSF